MIRSQHCSLLFFALVIACSAAQSEPEGAGGVASAGRSTASSGQAGIGLETGTVPPFAGASAGSAVPTGGTGSAAAGAGVGGSSAGSIAGVPGGASGGGAAGSSGTAPENLALNRCYRPACTAQWNNDPCNAFDGNLSTATGSAKAWDSSLGSLAVDFGTVQPVTKVVVSFEDNADPNPGYALEGSSDGENWTMIKDVTNPSLVDTQVGLNASVRYLRVHCKQFFFDPWWVHSVREIEIW